MTSIVLSGGSRVVDALTVPNPADVRSAGFGAFCPYLRNFTVAQRDAFWNEGIGLLLIQEGTGLRASHGSVFADADFTTAVAEAEALGWDGTTPLDYSETDFDVQPYQFADCDAYYGRIIALHQSHGYALPVIYGARAYINHAAQWVPHGVTLWEAAGWKWTDVAAADVSQQVQQELNCDVDNVITNLTVWTGLGSDIPKGNDMGDFRFYRDGNGNAVVFQVDHGYKYPLTGNYFYGVLEGQAVNVTGPSPFNVLAYEVPKANLDAVALAPDAPDGNGLPPKPIPAPPPGQTTMVLTGPLTATLTEA